MTSRKSSGSTDDQYTDPDLRDRIKAEVMAGDKGGKPGQWSARKAQMVAHEYEAQGGGYKHERTEAQEHLHEWTGEHWKTSDGKPAIRDGETTRYLPEEAWKELSPGEKQATNEKKVKGSKQGKQYVPNTAKASEARQHAELTPAEADKARGTRKVAKTSASEAKKKTASKKKAAPKKKAATPSKPSKPAKRAGATSKSRKGK